jgi:hypothetical protein
VRRTRANPGEQAIRSEATARVETPVALADLVPRWLAEAALFADAHALVDGARLARKYAGELEAAIKIGETEHLTLKQASDASGLSRDHLGRLVRQGKIPNAGRHGAPRILRANLPRIKGRLPDAAPHGTVAQVRADLARSVVTQS